MNGAYWFQGTTTPPDTANRDTFSNLVNFIAARGGSGTLGYCPWPNGMIGRVEQTGETAVFLIHGANYKQMGTACWVSSNAKVIQHGGWGQVWMNPQVVTWSNAKFEMATNHGTCGANGPTCWSHIPACAPDE